jgi:hypothetical protein
MTNQEIRKRLDPLLKQLADEKSFDVAEKVASTVLELLDLQPERRYLVNFPRVDAELSRFELAPNFDRQAAAFDLPVDKKDIFDPKLFWIKKTSKTNLSWLIGLAPNFEDSEANDYKSIGIDFVIPSTCDSVIILLSNKYKVRSLELKGHLTHTQYEIFTEWTSIDTEGIEDTSEMKRLIHSKLWESFDFEPVNRKFYLELVEHFSLLVLHLEKTFGRKPSVMFTTRLIGRILFIWFLRKKGLVNQAMDYFTVENPLEQSKYYRNKLEILFFETLNKEAQERADGDVITPYLNGGLFDAADTDFYGNEKLSFPNGFFNHLFETLSKYNFTVDESSPEFQQVAVDPEMLGRIFECLLAEQIDDNTGNSKKKATGAFYTPREIVSYMCEKSVIEYLKTKISDTPDRDRRIEELVKLPETIFRDQDQNKRRDWKPYTDQIIKALDGNGSESPLTVLDPAVGSGAFPMGMLQLLVKIYTRLDSKYEKNISQLKRSILSKSLYGVDIEQTAIEICRLRAWLSIIVDVNNGEKIEPLPNLDFKFTCANTLLPLDFNSQAGLFEDQQLKEKLMSIRDDYFTTSNKAQKKKLQADYEKLTHQDDLFDNKRTKQLKSYKPFDVGASSEFYDPEVHHGIKDFNIVIGNPPYIRIHKQQQDADIKKTLKDIYTSAYKDFDYYVLFMEMGLRVLKGDGVLAFITPDKYLVREYGSKIRKLIFNYSFIELFDLSRATDIFDASTYPLITFIQKNSDTPNIRIKLSKTIANLNDQYKELELSKTKCIEEDRIEIIDSQYDELIKKIFDSSQKFSDLLDSSQLFCGTPRAKDYPEWKNFVSTEPKSSDNVLPLLVCSNIKPYVINHNKKVRTVGLNIISPYFENRNNIISPSRWADFSFHPKILIRGNDTRISAVLDKVGSVFVGIYGIKIEGKIENSYKYMLACLNSKLYQWVFMIQNPSIKIGGDFFSINSPHILRLPYRSISDKDNDVVSSMVDSILELTEANPEADISALMTDIDKFLYRLFDLTEEQIFTVENTFQSKN